jgi:hypothetical protein
VKIHEIPVNIAEFRKIKQIKFPTNGEEFRGNKKSLPDTIPASAELQQVTSVDTLFIIKNQGSLQLISVKSRMGWNASRVLSIFAPTSFFLIFRHYYTKHFHYSLELGKMLILDLDSTDREEAATLPFFNIYSYVQQRVLNDF